MPREGHQKPPPCHRPTSRSIFSTKNREPRIATEWSERLHAYLGGVADHVHILLGLPATARLADVVRDIKSVSSKWVHDETGDRAFAWQEGYGAFSVSPSHRENVRNYIAPPGLNHFAARVPVACATG